MIQPVGLNTTPHRFGSNQFLPQLIRAEAFRGCADESALGQVCEPKPLPPASTNILWILSEVSPSLLQ